MVRAKVSVRLDGLANARKRIKVLNGRATDLSISRNLLRIAGGYNQKQCPVDTTELIRSFTALIQRRYMRLRWSAPHAAYVNDPRNSEGKPINTTAKGYAEAIARNTATDIATYAKTGRKPRLRAARRFGNNRNSV